MCCWYTFFVDQSFEMGATGRETANFVGSVAKVTGTYTGGLMGRMPCADHMADQAVA